MDGLMRIEKKFLPELRKWIAQQQGLEAGGIDDDNDDEDVNVDAMLGDEDAR